MGKIVTPKVFYVGATDVDTKGIREYLEYTDQKEFLKALDDATDEGLSGAECLCSMFAKLCYKALTDKKNKNIKRVRDISDNIKGTFDSAHGSVFEHVSFNLIVTDCSRVFTHELVRHRVGTAFSQTSGRYVRGDSIDHVLDPILAPIRVDLERFVDDLESKYRWWCDRMGLNGKEALVRALEFSESPDQKAPSDERVAQEMKKLDMDVSGEQKFDTKKKITSALRRYLPNGQSNEIAFSVNLRALRHIVQIRTAAGAEWEIRLVFNQIYDLLKARFPLIFHGAREKIVDGQRVVYGMTAQPYEFPPGDLRNLEQFTTEQLQKALADTRG